MQVCFAQFLDLQGKRLQHNLYLTARTFQNSDFCNLGETYTKTVSYYPKIEISSV